MTDPGQFSKSQAYMLKKHLAWCRYTKNCFDAVVPLYCSELIDYKVMIGAFFHRVTIKTKPDFSVAALPTALQFFKRCR
jgi:hypothetical protein